MSNNRSAAVFSRWLGIMFAYRKHAGSWAFILHRLTGIGLTVYIYVHIVLLTTLLKGEHAFNEEMALFRTPVFLFLEWLLGSLVMFHALNGLRIALVDLGNGARYHKPALVFVYVLGVILIAGMGFLIFQHA